MPLVSLHDYLRPWKLFSLACGIAILIAGSYLQPAPDWDIPISFLMQHLSFRPHHLAHAGAAAVEIPAAGAIWHVVFR